MATAPDSEAQFLEALQWHRQGDLRRASGAYEALVAAGHGTADVASNLSAVRLQLGDGDGSERYARLALQVRPDHANAWNHLGLALKTRGAGAEVAAAFRRCVAIEPGHDMAWYNLAEVLAAAEDTPGAVEAYARAVAADPGNALALVGLVHRKQQIASWDGLDEALSRLSAAIRAGDGRVDPFALLFCCTDPAELQRAARNKAGAIEGQTAALFPGGLGVRPDRPADGRIRVAYVSANFYDHAVGTLICQMLEAHDRSRFEVYAYCHSGPRSGPRRERIKAAVDRFVEIDGLDDGAAARLIRDDGVDVLVDLMGYTLGQRLGIFALRPAPVQVSWIGFAGTLGGVDMDYIIADAVVIPPGQEGFYDEAVVRMPVCYQVNDAARRRSDQPMSRRQFGIPDEAVVYCCFNQTAKITPPVLALWARILAEVPDGVLWLWRRHPAAEANLRIAFTAAGGDAARLYFGETLPEPEHLTRYGLCDLFLDTAPYGGHATASNALYGGCPLLALPGRTFASKVSSSLLTALGLTDLIAASAVDYVAKAVRVGRDPDLRARLKARLQAAISASPLFDGARFSHDLERAMVVMVERHEAGLPASPIDPKAFSD